MEYFAIENPESTDVRENYGFLNLSVSIIWFHLKQPADVSAKLSDKFDSVICPFQR